MPGKDEVPMPPEFEQTPEQQAAAEFSEVGLSIMKEKFERNEEKLQVLLENIAPCPYCPEGDVALACTDLGNEDEFQVWCAECWAHGPSRETAADAVEDWNEVSVSIRGPELKRGEIYVVIQEIEGYWVGSRIVFRWRTEDGVFNVFNPEGSGDIDTAFKIKAAVTDYFISAINPVPS